MICSLLCIGTAASAGVRLESGVGVDSNVRRIESGPGESDLVYRLVLDAEGAFRPSRRTRLGLGYQAGARHFQEIDTEDALFQRFAGTFTAIPTDTLALGFTLSANDRTTRAPSQPRDYTRLGAGPRVDLRLGDWILGARGQAEQLFFKPDEAFSATGLGGDLSLTYRGDDWSAGALAGLLARRFEGDRQIRVGETDAGPVVLPAEGRREDTAWRASVSARYVGSWLGEAQYGVVRNASNSYGGTFTRHQVSLSATSQAPLGVVASAKVGLQRDAYDDPQYVATGGRIEDEGRSSVSLRLERPIVEAWSVVATGGWWFSPSGASPEYSRTSAILGLAFNDVGE